MASNTQHTNQRPKLAISAVLFPEGNKAQDNPTNEPIEPMHVTISPAEPQAAQSARGTLSREVNLLFSVFLNKFSTAQIATMGIAKNGASGSMGACANGIKYGRAYTELLQTPPQISGSDQVQLWREMGLNAVPETGAK